MLQLGGSHLKLFAEISTYDAKILCRYVAIPNYAKNSYQQIVLKPTPIIMSSTRGSQYLAL